MLEIPSQPFFNKDFSDRGGGIDFLGLGSVNLDILTTDLIPEINNATSDIGTYFIATWIPWKFEEICRRLGPKSYSLGNFKKFRERVEVALAVVMRDGSPAEEKFGRVQRKIGTDQKLKFPSDLSFKSAGRTEATSLYAAPLYGPSVRYLDLVGYAVSQSGGSSGIPKTLENPEAILIAEYVDSCLRKSRHYRMFDSLDDVSVKEKEIDDLGVNGLHPSFYRTADAKIKDTFSRKLFESKARLSTTQLLAASFKEVGAIDLDSLKDRWYSDVEIGKTFSENLLIHQKKWALFMGRQYQRFILELFLKCFEEGLKRGRNSITSIVNDLILSAEVKSKETFFDLLKREAAEVGINESAVDGMSLRWHQVVNQSNPAFEGVFLYDENVDPGKQAVVGLARWYLRARALVNKAQDGVLLKIASAGSVERVSLKYMVNWLDNRLDQPLAKLLYDLISNFVFAQHLRVALSRFDGRLQRIRFLLDDEGIVLTSAMKEREAGIDPYMMADRSFALASLLTDLGILSVLIHSLHFIPET